MEDKNKSFYEQKYQINITLASQLRINSILDRLTNLDANYPIDSAQKQKSYLNLVKQYIISAIPYLSPGDAKKYGDEILSFTVNRKAVVKNGTQIYSYQFDPKLDIRLNQILIELQQKLRRVFTRMADDEEDDGL